MKIRKSLLIIVLSSVLLFNCGFTVIKKDKFQNFGIFKIDTSGENRINYILKNKLKNISNESENNFHLDIKSNKLKIIKEKNIKNEITKYQISIKVSIDYKLIGNNDKGSFVISKSGVFDVNSQYSKTINNEKNLIKSLTVEILDELLNNLRIITDDL